MYNVQWMTEISKTRLSMIFLSALGQKLCYCVMEGTSESLGAVLRAFCPCGLVRQALNYILRGVRIGADRAKITLFLRGAERVHVPTVCTEQHVMNELHLALMLRVFKALFMNTCVLLLLSVDWSQAN